MRRLDGLCEEASLKVRWGNGVMGYWENVLFTGRTQDSPLQEPIPRDRPVRSTVTAGKKGSNDSLPIPPSPQHPTPPTRNKEVLNGVQDCGIAR
jgi:hypothetical protein